MVPEGFEPPTPGSVIRCSIQTELRDQSPGRRHVASASRHPGLSTLVTPAGALPCVVPPPGVEPGSPRPQRGARPLSYERCGRQRLAPGRPSAVPGAHDVSLSPLPARGLFSKSGFPTDVGPNEQWTRQDSNLRREDRCLSGGRLLVYPVSPLGLTRARIHLPR